MDNFSKTCAAIILLLSLAAGAVVLDAKAEDYTPDEAAQEEQEQAPSIDTSSYVQVADPALYAKLDTLQESIRRIAQGAGCAVLRICCCRQGILRLAYLLCQLFDAGFHLFCKLCQRRGSLFAHAGDAPSCVAVCIDWIAEAISFFAAKSALSA